MAMKRKEEEEALVVCGEKKKVGITVIDLDSGDVLLRIPTSSSPPRGLLCLNKHVLVASQLQTDRPFGCGSIFFWPVNRPQAGQISYPMEAIGPIASSKDGMYLAGGAPSGNAYIWQVSSGRLLKNWHAHFTPLNCLAFSHDGSFLVSGAKDGTICIWSLISLLDTENTQTGGSLAPFPYLSAHGAAVTGLVPVFGTALISSSLDGTCKVWDIVSGTPVQTHVFSVAVTAIAVDPCEQMLFAGREDGNIYVNELHLRLQEDQITVSEDESGVLSRVHRRPVTALAFNFQGSLLISASEDCTACLWDVASWQVLRSFDHGERITNLMVIPKSSLSATDSQRGRLRTNKIPSLEKTCQLNNAPNKALVVTLPGSCSCEVRHALTNNLLSSDLLAKQILDSEDARRPESIQMKIETSIENRLWVLSMTKHINSINHHLQSRVTDMMRYRLCGDDDDDDDDDDAVDPSR